MSSLTAWQQGLANAGAALQAGVRRAVQQYATAIEEAPEEAVAAVRDFHATLVAWRALLDRWAGLLHQPGATDADRARHRAWLDRWLELATPFYGDGRPEEEVVGGVVVGLAWAPVVLVGTIAVGVAGTSWAWANRDQARALMEQSRVDLAELEARLEAMRSGKTLQDSTLRPSTPPGSDPGEGWSQGQIAAAVAGGLVVVGVGAGLAWYALRGS